MACGRFICHAYDQLLPFPFCAGSILMLNNLSSNEQNLTLSIKRQRQESLESQTSSPSHELPQALFGIFPDNLISPF